MPYLFSLLLESKFPQIFSFCLLSVMSEAEDVLEKDTGFHFLKPLVGSYFEVGKIRWYEKVEQ